MQFVVLQALPFSAYLLAIWRQPNVRPLAAAYDDDTLGISRRAQEFQRCGGVPAIGVEDRNRRVASARNRFSAFAAVHRFLSVRRILRRLVAAAQVVFRLGLDRIGLTLSIRMDALESLEVGTLGRPRRRTALAPAVATTHVF